VGGEEKRGWWGLTAAFLAADDHSGGGVGSWERWMGRRRLGDGVRPCRPERDDAGADKGEISS
jgi:hypothetical protein